MRMKIQARILLIGLEVRLHPCPFTKYVWLPAHWVSVKNLPSLGEVRSSILTIEGKACHCVKIDRSIKEKKKTILKRRGGPGWAL